eukprot:2662178-Rhodomonas_salina.7
MARLVHEHTLGQYWSGSYALSVPAYAMPVPAYALSVPAYAMSVLVCDTSSETGGQYQHTLGH